MRLRLRQQFRSAAADLAAVFRVVFFTGVSSAALEGVALAADAFLVVFLTGSAVTSATVSSAAAF